MDAKSVDVLAAIDAVMDWAREVSDQFLDSEDGTRDEWRAAMADAREARAAVAELVEAAAELCSYPDPMDRQVRLSAALARATGT